MNDEDPSSRSQQSWFERLTQLFSTEPQDRDELITLMRDAEKRGLIKADSLAMIEGVLHVSQMRVRDVMIPRPQMVVVERGMALDEMLPVVIESAHSRFPVVDNDRSEVVGIVLAKDLLQYAPDGKAKRFDLRDILRPATFVPASKRLDVLLKEFRSSRNHMAVVVDEYGAAMGVVTIEDVLEQIVGEIEDEHDFESDTDVLMHSDGSFIVKANVPIDEFNEHFDVGLKSDDVETIGGLVVRKLGAMPKSGDRVRIKPFEFEVVRADRRRVHLLRGRKL